MNEIRSAWRVNIPEVTGAPDISLDDLGMDGLGRIYVADGWNGTVYRFTPSGELEDAFSVIKPSDLDGEETAMVLAVFRDSSFCVGDAGAGRVIRYDSAGLMTGEFAVPGLVALSCAPDDSTYALASDGEGERVECYDMIGSRMETLCAPRRHRVRLGPGLARLDSDAGGRAFLSYGMPPYRVWCVTRSASPEELSPEHESDCIGELQAWGRDLDHPEDAVLVSDLSYDSAAGALSVLLACRESGRQVLDLFSSAGDFLDSIPLPHSDNLYNAVCCGRDGSLLLLDDAVGDLVCLAPMP